MTISPIAFDLFGIPVHWYGVMIMIGVLTAVCMASVREKRYKLPKDTSLNIILLALPAAILCARLYYVAFSWGYFSLHPDEIFSIRNGGLAIYGGLIGGIATGVVYARLKGISVSALADLTAPCLAIGQAFGRWGNFFNQEAYGAAILNEKLCFFPIGVYINSQAAWHYATFFYESAWCLLICAVLLLAERKKWLYRSGDAMLWYAIAYAAERVAVEGLRTDSLYLGSIRVSQLLSAALLLAGAIALVLRLRTFRLWPILLPSAVLILLILCGVSIPFGWMVALSVLQLASCFCAYYIIRKKAFLP